MAEPPVLDASLLARLVLAWQAESNPLVTYLQPGLTDREMDETTGEIDLRLPAEARIWWGTHDGNPPGTPSGITSSEATFLPLVQAVSITADLRRNLAGVTYPSGVPVWPDSWLVWTLAGRLGLALDCGTPGLRCPVHRVWIEDLDEYDARFPTMGTVVLWWTEALESRAVGYDAEAGRWFRRTELLPPEVRDLGII